MKARLGTESYPQPEDKVLAMICSLTVGALPHCESSFSRGDLGATCIEPVSPAVTTELQMNAWSMLLTRALFGIFC